MLEDARSRTRQAVANIDQRILDWAAGHRCNSVGTLLYHLAAIEADWLYAEVLEQPVSGELLALLPEEVRDSADYLTTVRGRTLTEAFALLDAVRAHLVNIFERMTAVEFRRVRHLPAYDVTPEWVLHHLSQHEAEHRGEILLLRERAEPELNL